MCGCSASVELHSAAEVQLECVRLTCKDAQPFASQRRAQPRHPGALVFIVAVAALESLFPFIAPPIHSTAAAAAARPGFPALLGYHKP